MNIDAAIEARKAILEAMKKKVTKINFVASVLVRNKVELDTMRRRYEALDRAIFMETKGVTKVSIRVRVSKKPLTTDELIATMSYDQVIKLKERLAARIEASERAKAEKSLSEKGELS